ncbi:hypothetical protein GKC30_14800 [Pseudodesulfovibrio sp. F-1]|uniref:Peptidoglycan binding-like domain-containing protein n=1 Tax=Pseudodesulfovibrio alkaliphilus TaxID=2661613 RepID=A0A7K1KS29_9BACT|nr:hypothetical protein [Pseudodesulfovibrio alkaliphilus]
MKGVKSIREAQFLLKKQGYNISVVDGICGQNTKEELEKFQRSEGLEPNGLLTIGTLNALKSFIEPANGKDSRALEMNAPR